MKADTSKCTSCGQSLSPPQSPMLQRGDIVRVHPEQASKPNNYYTGVGIVVDEWNSDNYPGSQPRVRMLSGRAKGQVVGMYRHTMTVLHGTIRVGGEAVANY